LSVTRTVKYADRVFGFMIEKCCSVVDIVAQVNYTCQTLLKNFMKSTLIIHSDTGVIDRVMPSGAVRCSVGTVTKSGYVVVWDGEKLVPAHRLIWQNSHGLAPEHLDIDHINGCKSDNRIENLRLVTRSQNNQNVRLARVDNQTSGVKGVSLHKQSGKWRARIKVNRRHIHIGNFDTIEQAADAYSHAALTHHTHNPLAKEKPRGLWTTGLKGETP